MEGDNKMEGDNTLFKTTVSGELHHTVCSQHRSHLQLLYTCMEQECSVTDVRYFIVVQISAGVDE